jgi:mono/diheme cytochrome c family protein
VVGFLIQRRGDQWCATCHGGLLHLGGEIHDEIALG